MIKFEDTERGRLLQELHLTLGRPDLVRYQYLVGAIIESFKGYEEAEETFDKKIEAYESLSLRIVTSLSPMKEGESPKDHHERCQKWLKEIKDII